MELKVETVIFLGHPVLISLILPERVTLGVGGGGVGVHPEHVRLGCAHVFD